MFRALQSLIKNCSSTAMATSRNQLPSCNISAPREVYSPIETLTIPVFLLRIAILQVVCLCMPAAYAQTCTTVNTLGTLTPPTNVKQMIYSPTYGRLIVRNSGSATAT